ncbi:MAG: hypothetical protein CMF25_03960 [Kangiellaceae bacterium]|jgi:hypothetical protein|nr:hypothetical protein [Kangiellaceae bacterium]
MAIQSRSPYLNVTLLIWLGLCSFNAYAYAGLSLKGVLDIQSDWPVTDDGTSWTERGLNKQLVDDSNAKLLRLGQAGLAAEYELTSTQHLKLNTLIYDEPEQGLAVTEAFWHFKPIPTSPWRSEWKLGAFYPPISLENRGVLWTSPYSISYSAINSWVAEELRTFGLESNWRWRDAQRQDWKLFGAIFRHNDPAGSLLAWRGWAIHDRQYGINESIPFPDLMVFEDGEPLENQARDNEPFLEVDQRWGFYAGLGREGRNLEWNLMAYNNNADPSQITDGQYSWDTKFTSLSARWRFGEHWELLGQGMTGSSVMKNHYKVRVTDIDFDAAYVMLARSWHRQRLATRLEYFHVDDNDTLPYDDNNESGYSAMLSYGYKLKNYPVKLIAEALHTRSDRPARRFMAQDEAITENKIAASVRYFWRL